MANKRLPTIGPDPSADPGPTPADRTRNNSVCPQQASGLGGHAIGVQSLGQVGDRKAVGSGFRRSVALDSVREPCFSVSAGILFINTVATAQEIAIVVVSQGGAPFLDLISELNGQRIR